MPELAKENIDEVFERYEKEDEEQSIQRLYSTRPTTWKTQLEMTVGEKEKVKRYCRANKLTMKQLMLQAMEPIRTAA